MDSDNEIFYMLYSSQRDGKVTVVTVQWFDMFDLDEARLIDKVRYETKAEAVERLIQLGILFSRGIDMDAVFA